MNLDLIISIIGIFLILMVLKKISILIIKIIIVAVILLFIVPHIGLLLAGLANSLISDGHTIIGSFISNVANLIIY